MLFALASLAHLARVLTAFFQAIKAEGERMSARLARRYCVLSVRRRLDGILRSHEAELARRNRKRTGAGWQPPLARVSSARSLGGSRAEVLRNSAQDRRSSGSSEHSQGVSEGCPVQPAAKDSQPSAVSHPPGDGGYGCGEAPAADVSRSGRSIPSPQSLSDPATGFRTWPHNRWIAPALVKLHAPRWNLHPE